MTRPSPDWFPDWSGFDCLIVASGPSVRDLDLSQWRDAKVIALNNSWRLVPWAAVLYASDEAWWSQGQGDGFAGLKVSRSDWPGVEKVELRKAGHDRWVDEIILDPGVVGSGGCSGFQALNLAIQFGARRIALAGFDCRIDHGTHWHGDHAGPLHNPGHDTVASWVEHLDRAAPVIEALGVEVINLSPTSALTGFRKAQTFREA